MKKFNFDNTYKTLSDTLFTKLTLEAVSDPKLLIYNKDLAEQLGLSKDIDVKQLSGNKIPEGADPLAQAYMGHQFGHLNMLGDGRAVLLGEHITPNNDRVDIQLKGSGRTPYSRSGDGRGTLYSMLREYIISHAMEHLHIPTTKSLAVVATGDNVYREKIEQGGILTRVASSHIRVGTFQYVATQGDLPLLRTFTDYVIKRHYPELINESNPYLSLLKEVMNRQIDLTTGWLRVGFIHGVMNTDNVSIAGETIDFGPCAFMDIYNPETVFSSIDRAGRYSFENQVHIGGWNMARFAECLIPLIDSDTKQGFALVNKVLEEYKPRFDKKYLEVYGHKLGLENNSDKVIIDQLLSWMVNNKSDYTLTFRSLLDDNFLESIPGSDSTLREWHNKWLSLNPDRKLLSTNNPDIIPRNHIVESVLKDAVDGNMAPIEKYLTVLSSPYSENNIDYYRTPPVIVDKSYRTFCGT